MDPAAKIPADGPDAVLSQLAGVLDLPHGHAQIARALAAHPRPTSLLALVDVGSQLGLKLTPARSNEAALAGQRVPFIAHFNGETGGGFGVVEKISADGFEVWDSAHGARILERDVFLEHWSGVVVLAEPPEPAARTLGSYRWRRLGEVLAGTDPPAVVGSPSAGVVGALFGVLLVALLGIALAAQPADTRVASAGIALLSLAGAAVTGLMTVALADYGGPFAPGLCRRRRFVDCQSVLASRFARVLGFPLSDLGIAFYAAILLLLAVGGARPAALVLIRAAFAGAVAIAVVLIALQVVLRRVCTLCLAVHAINAVSAVIAWAFLPGQAGLVDVAYTALLFGLLFSVVLFFVIPYLKQSKALARLAATHGRMSGSPFASLAQLATETPTGLGGAQCGVQLGSSSANDELVAFVHPSCKQCEPVLRELHSLAAAGRVSVYVAIPPRDASERRLCETILAVGLSSGAETMLRAYGVAKRRFGELLGADPVRAVGEELALSSEAIAGSAPAADALVRRAEQFAAEHVEGTPALFFNSLPYRGPVAHLITLLTEHADLLPRPHPGPVEHAPGAAVRT